MRVIFVLRDVKEARILKGFLEESGVEVKVFDEVGEAVYQEADLLFVDVRCLNEELKEEQREPKTKRERPYVVFIVPFWMRFDSQTARELGRRLGFRTAKYIKRPFTPSDILTLCTKMTGSET